MSGELIMPADFPISHHEAISKLVSDRAPKPSDIYWHFAGAWKAMTYRFVALTEHEADFICSLSVFGTDGAPSQRYRQEQDLFGFFTNGFSLFELAFYGLFSVGAL